MILGELGPHDRIGHAPAPAQPDSRRAKCASHEPGATSTTANLESAALFGQTHSTPALATECEAKDMARPPVVQALRGRVYRELPLLAADLPYAVVTVPPLGLWFKMTKRRLV
jgi:hypothetical protein